jgi:CheY-like chemotaxis protein
MTIDYNILWLDDQIEEFIDDDWVEKIKVHLEDEGFIPNVITVSKQDDFFEELNENFDLILTDYNMSGKDGSVIVKEIREKAIMTEILFYTARGQLNEIGKIDRVSFVETQGNHQEQVVGEILKLIDLTIKKFQHIVSMRGMIMHETSYLDSQANNIITKYVNSEKVDCDELTESICDKLVKHLESKSKIVQKTIKNKNLRGLMKDTFLFSAEYKIESLGKLLHDLNMQDFSSNYKDEIINIRNKFAHVTLEIDEKTGKKYFKGKEEDIIFNEELCRKIRKDIKKYKNNIDELDKNLKIFLGIAT